MNYHLHPSEFILSRERCISPSGEGPSFSVTVRRLHHMLHGILLLSLILAALVPIENHPISLTVYLFICTTTLLTALSARLPYTLNLLAIVVSYEPVTRPLFPAIHDKVFFSLFLVVVCLILGMRFARRFSFVIYIFIIIALYNISRYLLDSSLTMEFFDATYFCSAAMLGGAIVTFPLRKPDLVYILKTICLAITGIVLMSICAGAKEAGLIGVIRELIVGGVRLGHLNALGHNSFAAQCFVGYACGFVLLKHRTSSRLAWVSIIICGSAILMSKSRGSIFPAMALPIVLFGIFNWKRRFVVTFIVCMSFVMVFIFSSLNQSVRLFLRSDTDIAVFSLAGRAEIWNKSLEKIQQNALTGLDSNELKCDTDFLTYTTLPNGSRSYLTLTPHNIVIAYLLYYGIILGGMLLASMIYVLWRSFRKCSGVADYATVLVPIFGFIIHLSVDPWYFLYLFMFALISIPKAVTFCGNPKVTNYNLVNKNIY